MPVTYSVPPFDGFGVGLRVPHYDEALASQQPIDFVEVISENFMVDGGRPLAVLARARERYPVLLHGVAMNIGSVAGLDAAYLTRLRTLANRIEPLWISDHLCWTGVDEFRSHDLLPLPYSEEALAVVCRNVHQAQEALGRPLLLENPSTYLQLAGTMSEADFLAELCERTGCYLLLDVNNIVVSATNHGLSPEIWLDGLPLDRVRQIHLAGHSQGRDMLVDTHDAPVPPSVWSLYERFMARLGPVATMIERDDRIPPWSELLAEVAVARSRAQAIQAQAA